MMYTEFFKKWLWLLSTRNNLESLVELVITFEPVKTCEHAIILEASISKIKSLCSSFKRNLNDMSIDNGELYFVINSNVCPSSDPLLPKQIPVCLQF